MVRVPQTNKKTRQKAGAGAGRSSKPSRRSRPLPKSSTSSRGLPGYSSPPPTYDKAVEQSEDGSSIPSMFRPADIRNLDLEPYVGLSLMPAVEL